jgi:hypothetical protein
MLRRPFTLGECEGQGGISDETPLLQVNEIFWELGQPVR